MFRAMIKKEFNQFLKSKGNVIMYFLFPLILITVLSVGLKGMMDNAGEDIFTDNNNKKSKVYYLIDGESDYSKGFSTFIDGIEKAVDIEFEESNSEEEAKKATDEYESLAYITVSSSGFDIYTSNKGEKIKTKIFINIFESVLNEYGVYNTIMEYNANEIKDFVQNKYDNYISIGNDSIRNVTSTEYYTFAELALIIVYVATLVGESIYSETKMNTLSRIRLSKVSEGSIISSKIIFGVIVSLIQTIIVYIYTSFVLKVNWGENTIKLMLLFLAFGLFAATLGAIVGILAKKDTTVGGILNVITIVICAIGGCYTPIHVLVSIPVLNKIMYLDPIYWINVSTSSLICNYQSNSYYIALLYPILLSAIMGGIYLIIKVKKGGLYSV